MAGGEEDESGRLESGTKIVIAADIHGNFDAWSALPEDYDQLWVLGDLVNYGPQPREVLEDVRAKAALVVQGNHDNAVAHDDDSRWTSRYRRLSEVTRRFTSSVLTTEEHKAYLRSLPLHAQAECDGVRFHLTHGTPSDPLYGRHAPNSEECPASSRLSAPMPCSSLTAMSRSFAASATRSCSTPVVSVSLERGTPSLATPRLPSPAFLQIAFRAESSCGLLRGPLFYLRLGTPVRDIVETCGTSRASP